MDPQHSNYRDKLLRGWEKHIERLNDSYFSYIKHLISLSTLILSLTVSFQSNLPKISSFHRWLLRASWGSLAGSILCGLFALYAEVELYGKIAGETRRALRALEYGEERAVHAEISSSRRFAFRASVFLFGGGVAFLALYAITTI